MNPVIVVTIAAVAACVGSFLNVCIWRLPREESIVWPGSHCVRCGRAIAWYDNIPIVSFAALGGRCRHCRGAIAWRYPLVELLAVVIALGFYATFGLTWPWVFYTALGLALIVATFVDVSHRIIPDEITLPGIVIGLIASALVPSLHQAASPWLGLWRGVLGVLVGGGSLYLTGLLGDWLFKKESMGGGDVKLLAMAGALLGWQPVLLTFFLAPMLAIVPGLVQMTRKGDHTIPYGPFLSLGLLIVMLWGPWLLHVSHLDDTAAVFGAALGGLFRR